MAQLSSPSIALPRGSARPVSRHRTASIVAWLPLVGLLAGIISLFHLAQTSEITTTGYSIQELKAQESNWKLQNEQLALDLAKARSLAAVDAAATSRLLMVQPKEVVFLPVQSTSPVGRASPSSRGEPRQALVLEKSPVAEETGLLDPVQRSLSSVLAPRAQQPRR